MTPSFYTYCQNTTVNPYLPSSSAARTGNEAEEDEKEGPDGTKGGEVPEDIPVLRLNRKLGSTVISCFAECLSCSGVQLKGTNPFDITSHLRLRLDPRRLTRHDSGSRRYTHSGLKVVKKDQRTDTLDTTMTSTFRYQSTKKNKMNE